MVSGQGTAIHSRPVVKNRGNEWRSSSSYLRAAKAETGSIRDILIAVEEFSALGGTKS